MLDVVPEFGTSQTEASGVFQSYHMAGATPLAMEVRNMRAASCVVAVMGSAPEELPRPQPTSPCDKPTLDARSRRSKRAMSARTLAYVATAVSGAVARYG